LRNPSSVHSRRNAIEKDIGVYKMTLRKDTTYTQSVTAVPNAKRK